FDNASASIFLKGLDGRYLSVNRAFERAFGRPAADVVGRTNLDLFPSARVDEADARDAEVVRTGRPIEYEWRPDPGAADQRVFWIVKFPVRLADGSVQAICGISTDITPRVRAERDLEAAKEAAEEHARRAEALAWRADAANRAKTEFLANISHEIRTPLTAIFGYADLLLAPAIGAEERIDHVQTIRRNGEHLLSILNDVLDMSKIEAGRMTVERVPTPVPQVVADVVSLMRQRATEKGLKLGVACPTPVPVEVQSDPTRLRQILMNLVGNAVKFTETGGVHVDVWVDESHRDAELVFEVTDTGIGMTPEQVAAVGQPFTQGDPSHARRFGGSGLGLSICYRLAQLMGGTITCQSRPHAGTAFTLRLPCGDLAGVPRVTDLRDVTDAPAAGPGVPPAVAVAGRVLVAEDSPDTRRLLMTYLRNAGIDGETAENGQVAVARAMGAWRAGRPYDLLLMDVQMPQMDGLTATGVLRSHGYRGRIVALTANAMDQDRQRCLAAGCDEFLTKPIRGTALLSAVRHWLGGGDA
ncbi:MAG TPA: ATP-binding protein, partial [Humisphaera sp.]